MGIPDEESWFRRSYLPGGAASGWRRLVIPALLVIAVVVIVIAVAVR